MSGRASGGQELVRPAVLMGGSVGRPATTIGSVGRPATTTAAALVIALLAASLGYAADADATKAAAVADAGAAAGAFDKWLDAVYATPDEQELRADAYIPRGAGPFPGVLVVHGGAWMSGHRSHMARISSQLARHGYSAVSISYRLAPQYKWPAQIEDCRSALCWMHTHTDRLKIDPASVGALGYSAGGQLVAMLGVTETPLALAAQRPANAERDGAAGAKEVLRLKAVVAGGAPCDFRWLPRDSSALTFWLGGTRAEKPEVYDQASPAKFVSADDPPILFYHGDGDTVVPIQSPTAMAASLRAAGVSAELHKVKGGHIEAFFSDEGLNAAIEFLDKNLKPASDAPGTTENAE